MSGTARRRRKIPPRYQYSAGEDKTCVEGMKLRGNDMTKLIFTRRKIAHRFKDCVAIPKSYTRRIEVSSNHLSKWWSGESAIWTGSNAPLRCGRIGHARIDA